MDFTINEDHEAIRDGVRRLCQKFPDDYWRERGEKHEFLWDFYNAVFQAADRAIQIHGGMGYASEYDVERYWRETRLMRLAPVSQEMVMNFVAEHVLGLPRSY